MYRDVLTKQLYIFCVEIGPKEVEWKCVDWIDMAHNIESDGVL
jgi:hypothetical protein